MEDAKKRIEFYGVKPTRTQIRFLRMQIERWISRERSLLFLPQENSYLMSLEKSEASDLYSCQIRVQIGSRKWLSTETGKSLEDAAMKAMHHLHSNVLVALPRKREAKNLDGVAS